MRRGCGQWGVVHLSGLAYSCSWHAAAVTAAGNWVVSTNVYLSLLQRSWRGSPLRFHALEEHSLDRQTTSWTSIHC